MSLSDWMPGPGPIKSKGKGRNKKNRKWWTKPYRGRK